MDDRVINMLKRVYLQLNEDERHGVLMSAKWVEIHFEIAVVLNREMGDEAFDVLDNSDETIAFGS